MRGLTSAKSRRYDFLPSYDAVGCPSALAFHDYQPLFTQCSQIPSYGTLADTGVRRDRGDGHALAFGEHVDDCGIYRVSPIFHLRVRLTRPRCGAHPSLGAQTPLQYEVCLIHCLRIGHPREHPQASLKHEAWLRLAEDAAQQAVEVEPGYRPVRVLRRGLCRVHNCHLERRCRLVPHIRILQTHR